MDGNVCRASTNKVCKACKVTKKLDLFYFNKTKNTYFSECKECNKSRSSKWNKNNKEVYKQYKKKDYLKNIDKYKQYGKSYRNSENGKKLRNALNKERENLKRGATPKWLTKEQRQEMKNIYKNCPKGYHVDHIHPLRGVNFCGLHVPWNLQYLPASENIRKRNKLIS